MARIDTPTQSDDGFDVIHDGDTVCDVADGSIGVHETLPSNSPASPGPLAGQHEVPQVPQSQDRDPGVALVTQQLSEQSIEDSFRESGSSKGEHGSNIVKDSHKKLGAGNKVALIAVMGMTGTGKTTFISRVTGRSDLQIGHDLTSCTQDIQVIETKLDGQTVRFIDTPGFSDTKLSDTEVLQMIADYLAMAYKQEMKLSGIIYLHPISEIRVTHHMTKNLDMFRKLTGEKNLKKVTLATTMWDKVSEDEGIRREEQLKSNFWKFLMAMGAKTARHLHDSQDSAQGIASAMLGNQPFYLQLQEEVGKENKALRDTAAGREVVLELARLKEQHQRELAEMEDVIKSSAKETNSNVEAMKEHYRVLMEKMEKTLSDERRMNEEAVRSLKDRINGLENRPGCAVM